MVGAGGKGVKSFKLIKGLFMLFEVNIRDGLNKIQRGGGRGNNFVSVDIFTLTYSLLVLPLPY